MTLKEKFLNIKRLDEFTDKQFIELMNTIGMEDKDIYNHYKKITKDYDFEEANKKLEEEISHGFEVMWLLRKEKNNKDNERLE